MWQCDDWKYLQGEGCTIAASDFWKIYVRIRLITYALIAQCDDWKYLQGEGCTIASDFWKIYVRARLIIYLYTIT